MIACLVHRLYLDEWRVRIDQVRNNNPFHQAIHKSTLVEWEDLYDPAQYLNFMNFNQILVYYDVDDFTPNTDAVRTSMPGDPRGASDRQRRFAEVLGTAQRRADAELSPEQQARESAEQLVAIAFIQPILSQLRSTDNAAEPFKATQGEQQFRALWDAQIAQDMVRASNFPLVDAIAEKMLRTEPPAETES